VLKLDDFNKLHKTEFLNGRFVYGGGVQTQSVRHDEYAHTDSNDLDQVVMSGNYFP
jgi:hypothetical protein